MRILFLLTLAILLNGCGQSYEEINGFKLGAPISTIKDIDSYKGSINDDGITIYMPIELTFDYDKDILIGVLAENIEMLSFSGTKKGFNYDNFRFELSKMVKRWGDPEMDKIIEKDDGVSRYIQFKPKNGIIGVINFSYSPDKNGGFLHESYSTKKIMSLSK